ncbi:MAG TPA: protein kinase family protein [Jiangellaceae bacterium]|nr:protein kinase family protein [Jiangellaceae bacterium]
MSEPAVGPGRLLAGRYRVEDLLDEDAGVRSWRAIDAVLSRPVFVQTLPAGDPRAAHVIDAARAAAQVRDSRFLQVLDVDVEDDTAYVVREWMSGRDLTMLLAGGPLSPDQAGALAREVAEALAAAHRDGLTHLLLRPGSVLITSDGGVKVGGLATEAVVHGAAVTDPGVTDAAGVGRVLYAALTGRWPDGDGQGLPEAPTIDGRVASPRQVRPGVPRQLDEIADRTLGNAARHHAAPLRSPAEVVDALTSRATTGRMNGLLGSFDDISSDGGRPPAVLDSPDGPLVSTAATPAGRLSDEPTRRGTGRLGRILGVLAGTLLLVAATLVGLDLLLSAVDGAADDDGAGTEAVPTTTTTPDPTTAQPAPEPTPLAISSAVDYDPDGDGDENPEDTPLAIDADPETAWVTQNYFDPLEDQKPGVGLYLDLGAALPVAGLNLDLVGEDSALEIRVPSDGGTEVPGDVDDWTVLVEFDSAGAELPVSLESPITTRYVLVWFTRLPPDGGDFRGGVAEAEVLG